MGWFRHNKCVYFAKKPHVFLLNSDFEYRSFNGVFLQSFANKLCLPPMVLLLSLSRLPLSIYILRMCKWGLHLYSAFFSLTDRSEHFKTQGHNTGERTIQWHIRVQYLAQGDVDMWTAGARDWTTDLLMSGRSLYLQSHSRPDTFRYVKKDWQNVSLFYGSFSVALSLQNVR